MFAVPKIAKDLDISALSRDNSDEADVKIQQTLHKNEFFGLPMGKMQPTNSD